MSLSESAGCWCAGERAVNGDARTARGNLAGYAIKARLRQSEGVLCGSSDVHAIRLPVAFLHTPSVEAEPGAGGSSVLGTSTWPGRRTAGDEGKAVNASDSKASIHYTSFTAVARRTGAGCRRRGVETFETGQATRTSRNGSGPSFQTAHSGRQGGRECGRGEAPLLCVWPSRRRLPERAVQMLAAARDKADIEASLLPTASTPCCCICLSQRCRRPPPSSHPSATNHRPPPPPPQR